MNEIIPSILVDSKVEFERRLRLVEHDVQTVQVDVLDGTKFGHTSYHDAKEIGALQTPVNYELHLMVENPVAIAMSWKQHVPNFKRAIFHAEIDRGHDTIIEALEAMDLEVGIALNPETPPTEALHDLFVINEILVMTVHPGSSGQGIGDPQHGFDAEDLYKKIVHLHNKYPQIILGADGGVDAHTLPRLKEAGISRFCVASGIFNAENPALELKKLINML